MSNFGFGSATGVDLPAETPGILHSPNSADWCEADLGTNSFGQGVSVTPLQMVNAVAAIANGGTLMRPYIVQEIHHDDQVSKTQPKEIRRVISEQVAREMTNMLVAATEAGCPQATVPGYHIAGKTGTAQVPVNGVYDPDPSQVVASYVGFAPAENPRFIMLITITRPKQEMWGGTVAAPVFQTLAGRFLTLLNVPPDPALLKKSANTP
jgi:cell division protein FtsI (penicillin-binding protein 3)